jgi:hypothetical protein
MHRHPSFDSAIRHARSFFSPGHGKGADGSAPFLPSAFPDQGLKDSHENFCPDWPPMWKLPFVTLKTRSGICSSVERVLYVAMIVLPASANGSRRPARALATSRDPSRDMRDERGFES